MKKIRFIATIALVAAVLLCPAIAQCESSQSGNRRLTRQLMFSAVYVKEEVDRPWQLRVTGNLPRGPGLHVLIYNEAGNFLKRADAPWGIHHRNKPFTIDIPADGKAQQYVIKVLGQQDNLNGLQLPLTNLPFEVYGDRSFAFGHGTAGKELRLVSFQPNVDGRPIHFSGWSAHYRILDATGNPFADSKDLKLSDDDTRKKGGPRHYEMIVPLKPGKTYWIDPYQIMYLKVHGANLYLTFDPMRWFEPNLTWTLESRPWWKGVVNVQ